MDSSSIENMERYKTKDVSRNFLIWMNCLFLNDRELINHFSLLMSNLKSKDLYGIYIYILTIKLKP